MACAWTISTAPGGPGTEVAVGIGSTEITVARRCSAARASALTVSSRPVVSSMGAKFAAKFPSLSLNNSAAAAALAAATSRSRKRSKRSRAASSRCRRLASRSRASEARST